MAKIKPYVMRNYNGTNSAMVAAGTLTEAARKLGCSVYHMRSYGWSIGTREDAAFALADPDVVFYRPIDNGRGYPWSRAQYKRDYSVSEIGVYRVATAEQ